MGVLTDIDKKGPGAALHSTAEKRSRVIETMPVYYGWIILAAAILGTVMTTPGQTAGVSVFLDKIIADLGLSRSTVSLMYTIGTLVGAFTLPYVGRFIDRRGPRVAVVVISALFTLACIWMGFVTEALTLFFGFLLIRSLGQGALGLVSLHVVNIWFVRRRGLAVGMLGVGSAIGTSVFPLFIEFLVGQLGWRVAYATLGGIVALTILPLGALFFRERPERYGLRPDGSDAPDAATTLTEKNLSLQEARRTPIFWLFASGGFLVSGLATGLVFHHYDIMSTNGLSRDAAALVFVPLGLVLAAANFTAGFLMDRVSPRFLLSVVLGLLSVALLFATQIDSQQMVLLYGGLLGVTMGMQAAVQGSVYAYYFGRSAIGAIKGFASTISVAGAAFGPFLFALGPDWFGSYAPILNLTVVAPLAVALAAFFIREPRPSKDTAVTEG